MFTNFWYFSTRFMVLQDTYIQEVNDWVKFIEQFRNLQKLILKDNIYLSCRTGQILKKKFPNIAITIAPECPFLTSTISTKTHKTRSRSTQPAIDTSSIFTAFTQEESTTANYLKANYTTAAVEAQVTSVKSSKLNTSNIKGSRRPKSTTKWITKGIYISVGCIIAIIGAVTIFIIGQHKVRTVARSKFLSNYMCVKNNHSLNFMPFQKHILFADILTFTITPFSGVENIELPTIQVRYKTIYQNYLYIRLNLC